MINNPKLKVTIFILISSFSVIAFAQSNTQKIPPGMEIVEIEGSGSGQLIVPKGAKTRKVGAQIIVEGTKEYMSRRFYEMEEKFALIERNQEELKQEVRELKEIIKTIQNNQQ